MSSTEDGRPVKPCFSNMMVAEKETRARVALRGTVHPGLQAVPDLLVNRECFMHLLKLSEISKRMS